MRTKHPEDKMIEKIVRGLVSASAQSLQDTIEPLSQLKSWLIEEPPAEADRLLRIREKISEFRTLLESSNSFYTCWARNRGLSISAPSLVSVQG